MTRRWQYAAISTAAVALIGAMVLVISARDASAAPNLVSNGDFASSITGWTNGPFDTGISWDSDDAGGSATSGSIQVDFLGTAPNTANALTSSCIDLTASGAGTYELAAAINNPTTNDFGTAVFVRVDLYAENTCSTLNNTFDTLPVINSGAWTLATEASVAVTGSDLGAIVSLWVDAAADAQTAFFDDVSFSNGAVDTPTPLPTETDTPEPDTATPAPPDTPTPEPDTPTPAPDTETPTPEPDTPTPDPAATETATPDPAATDTPDPAATDTPDPAATDTPEPAATDTPSAPAPTDTPSAPAPTDTPGAPAPTDTPGAASTSTPGGATSTPGGATSTPDAESTPEDEEATPEATEEAALETPVTAPTEPAGPPPASGIENPPSNPPMNDGGPGGITDLQQGGAAGLPDAGVGDTATETPFALAMAVLALTMAGSLLLIAHNVRRQEDRNG